MNHKNLLIWGGLFCGSVITIYGLIWTFFEVSGWFMVDFPNLRALGWIGHYMIVLHGVLIAMFFHVIHFWVNRANHSRDNTAEREVQNDLINQATQSSDIDLMSKDLISAIERAHHAERHEEVIRFGVALNRPLFVSGNHSTRLKIGTLVEDAAAVTGDETIQAEMLIDAIGWSLVELGNLDLGEKKCTAWA